MFAEERHRKIVDLLHADGTVKVKQLSVMFDVSEDCIRKDLAYLERMQLVKRIYGGAVLPREINLDPALVKRKIEDDGGKRIIAEKALSLIQPGDTIFLDISTINAILAKLLLQSGKRVTVVTNMIEIIQIFATQTNVTLIATGGAFNQFCDGFIGSICIDAISQYRFDLGFLGVVGVDPCQNSTYSYEPEEGLTKRAIVKASRKAYLLLEDKKFSRDGNYQVLPLNRFAGVITEKPPEPKILEALEQYNIEIL